MEIDKITKFLPMLGLALLVSGIIKLYAYYNQFGIAINDYISFSEASVSFVDDLMELLILFGFSILGFILINYYIDEEINDDDNRDSPIVKRTSLNLKFLKTRLVLI